MPEAIQTPMPVAGHDTRPLSTREDERYCTACGRKVAVTVANRRPYNPLDKRAGTFLSIECRDCSGQDDIAYWRLA